MHAVCLQLPSHPLESLIIGFIFFHRIEYLKRKPAIVPQNLLQKKQPWFFHHSSHNMVFSSLIILVSLLQMQFKLPIFLPKSGPQSCTNAQCHLWSGPQQPTSIFIPPSSSETESHFHSEEQCVQLKGYISQTSAKCCHRTKS